MPKQYYDVMDPFVSLTAAAAVTKTIKLGTGVCLLIQRDTIQTAKSVASLDQVSGGRFLFGIGGGWNAEEMEDHGTEFKSRFKKMREQIEAMKEIWTKDAAEYHGDLVDFGPMAAWPKPVQKPHPPVIVGGAFPHAARRALRYGNGWIPNASRAQYADVTDFLPHFKQMAAEVGRDLRKCRSRCGAPARITTGCAATRIRGRPARRQPAAGKCREDAAGARPLGRADPPRRALTANCGLARGRRSACRFVGRLRHS